ncbi:aldehyde dehydrogenase family protein [Hoeflea prorocentri]|uniref:Aldehyde dehydrogenase family protein n=1 Tax=Hoeflea prorocentri TaxID=1922333 RepID=A0A9X3UJY3_9HYPH|nr:aldehyde dehydrogenase family protein [Hoeflea prorocentri]MCY6382180.1 aldehyde dehydrogenase family protein [Hoeflea prorocentri]MDA5399980.1 aldehyde dehydrogenase family protein [Hoeflea prorocentri]
MLDLPSGKNGVSTYAMLINGAWADIGGRASIEVENPADQSVIATIPEGTPDDAHRALEAAATAQPPWEAMPAIERGRLVSRLADAVSSNRERLARIVVAEQGKPLNQAEGEIGAAETFLRYAAENARRIEGDILPSDNKDEEIWIKRRPYGVVAGLTAWNYPAALAARKLGPALVAGNTFVLLSHEFTPLSGLELARLAQQAGIPDGVFNVVTGRGPVVGRTLVESPLTDLVTMTGSTRAGREIYQSGAERLKVLRLELGGKAPFIVMEDADIDAAVSAAAQARYTNCGQICTCSERIYLHQDIADEFTEKFITVSKELSIGDPLGNPDIGAKISGSEVEKVKALVDEGVKSGAQILLEGGPLTEGDYSRGYWYAPTVLTVNENSSPLMQKEIFGPVVPIMRVTSFEQAIERANDTDFGLSAYVFTKNIKRLMEVSRKLNFGEIYFNRSNGEQVQGFHTGWGQSGLGGEDGKYGFDGYLRKQTTYVSWA